MKSRLHLIWILVLLLTPVARPEDAASSAKKIKVALDRNRYPAAMELWKSSGEAILEDASASLAMAKAFLDFTKGDLAKRYRQIPLECADAATACLDAAGKKIPESDKKSRLALARGYLDIAGISVARGRGKEGVKARRHALGILESVVAVGKPPDGARELLGRVHLALAGSDPKMTEDHLKSAAVAFEKTAKRSGSAPLFQLLGDTRVRLARLLEARLETAGGSRLEKSVMEAWEASVEAYEKGLKLAKDNLRLKTEFNECLWELKRLTEGKYRKRPILLPRKMRHGKLLLSLPASTRWQVLGESSLSSWNEILDALREDKRRGRYLRIIVDQYWWKSTFPITETKEAIKGDDLEGLARRALPVMRDYFLEATETFPQKKVTVGTKLPEATMWAMRGKAEGEAVMEYRMMFFKDPRSQFTYQITVIADVATLDRYPHELDCILASIAPVIRR